MRKCLFLIILISSVIADAEDFSKKSLSETISGMSLEQKVGQLFIFGFTGTDIKTSLAKQQKNLHPGSIIVFGRNIKSLNQIRKLNSLAQKNALKDSGVPLLIAVDQEGGKVIRIKTSPSLPSARTLALTNDPALVTDAGFVTGQLLSTLGFNMNLAPVVDISSPNQKDFLGNRAFGNQKEIVNQMSTAFAKGLISSGVLPTAKHFPGHGGVQTDSHLATPYKQITLPELLFTDLAPYKEMLNNELPFAIMASHISYPLIDPSKKPTTFSKIMLGKVLRKDLGFKGIVLTDDIQMGGAKFNKMTIGQRAVEAVLAGNDLVMVGWNYRAQRKAVRAVIKAVRSGKISKKRLNASLERILEYKKLFHSITPKGSLQKQLKSISISKTYNQIFEKVFKNQKLTALLKKGRTDVYSYSWRFLTSYKKKSKSYLRSLRKFRGWKRSARAKNIIYHLSGPSSAKILRSAPADIRKKMIIINSAGLSSLRNNEQYRKVVHVHSYHPKLGSITAKHLTNEPIRLPTSYK